MKRRKGKPHDPARDGAPKVVEQVFDLRDPRRPRPKAVGEIVIADPAGHKLRSDRQLRSDPLAWLHDRGHIDDAQYGAGRSFQNDWTLLERGQMAIDYSKVRVSGGLAADDSKRKSDAEERLGAVRVKLGDKGMAVVQAVLVEGRSMEQVANSYDQSGEVWARYFGIRFRECLEDMTVVYQQTNIARSKERLAQQDTDKPWCMEPEYR
jgi:hypothetical protein